MNKLPWMMVLSLPLVALAATKSPDESFYKAAAEGGLAEVQQGLPDLIHGRDSRLQMGNVQQNSFDVGIGLCVFDRLL